MSPTRCVDGSPIWRESPTMSEPHRLHPAAIVILAVRVAKELAIPALLPIVFSVINGGLAAISVQMLLLVILGALVVLSVSAVYGLLSWRRFTYRVEAGELRVEQGVISRRHRSIPLERVQSIDLAQGILQRLLGVVSVRVETAGGGHAGAEVSLPGISRDDSERLRSAVAGRRVTATAPPRERAMPVWRLSVADLLLAGSTGGRAGVALSIVAALLTFADDLLPFESIADYSEHLDEVRVLAILILLVALTIWLLGVAGTVLAHAGFTIAQQGDHLLIERGLIERRRATIPLDRIQAIRAVEGLVRQPFGLVELRVESAGYGHSAGESKVLYPLLRRADVQPFLRELAPRFAVRAGLQRPPARARRRYATRPVVMIPAALTALVASIVFFPVGLAAALLVPLAALLGLWQYHDAGWAVVDETLLLRWRALGRTTAIVPRRRVQFGMARQTPFQRRAGLASVSMHVPSGSDGAVFGARHLDDDDARRLLAWLLPRR
jgi:putative membrane protein